MSAKDKETGKEQKISIEGSSGLCEDEIEKAKRMRKAHADEDKKQDSSKCASADNAVYHREKQLENSETNFPTTQDRHRSQRGVKREALKLTTSMDQGSYRAACRQVSLELAQAAARCCAEQDPMAAAAAAAASGAGGVDERDAADEPKEAEGKVVDADSKSSRTKA